MKKKFDNERIFGYSNYFRINRASEILECTADELLHLGVMNQVRIMAPVFAEGLYEWSIHPESTLFPEIVERPKHYFNAADRVVLSCTDLAIIEASGCVTPELFYAPTQSKSMDELLKSFHDQLSLAYEPEDINTVTKSHGENVIFSIVYAPLKLLKPDSDLIPKRINRYFDAWYPLFPTGNDAATTINDLFISRKEIERLKLGQPQELSSPVEPEGNAKVVHGNTLKNKLIEISILKAAIYCYKISPNQCNNGSEFAKVIDEKALLFWKQGSPPRSLDWIERILRDALNQEKQLDFNNNNFKNNLWSAD